MPQYQSVAIVGVGLIGGSIGLAARQRQLTAEVVGVGRRQSSLDRALACGTVDRATTDLTEGVASAQLIVVATPVDAIVDNVCRSLQSTAEAALVTDAGSTKTTIVHGVHQHLPEQAKRFVGSHPLAGDHRTGPESARADLFEGRTVVVTPSDETDPKATERVESFWQSLGAEVVQMPPGEHDSALAVTSHLPHLVASALAASTPAEWLALTATGWSDTTRIAAADPELWTKIFSDNQQEVLSALDSFVARLSQVRASLAASDWEKVTSLLEQAKRTRDA